MSKRQSADTLRNIRKARENWESRQARKRDTIAENQAARVNRSDKEQLALLDTRPGKSRKEREKLNRRMDNE